MVFCPLPSLLWSLCLGAIDFDCVEISLWLASQNAICPSFWLVQERQACGEEIEEAGEASVWENCCATVSVNPSWANSFKYDCIESQYHTQSIICSGIHQTINNQKIIHKICFSFPYLHSMPTPNLSCFRQACVLSVLIIHGVGIGIKMGIFQFFDNNIIMQQGQNLFYRWEVLQNIGEYLSLKDLLATAVLSKQYNLLLRKYLKEHYSLPNSLSQSEFIQLRDKLNRRISVLPSANAKYSKMHPSSLVVMGLQAQSVFTLVTTPDGATRLVKTEQLIKSTELQLQSLPQKFQIVRISENNSLFCSDEGRILRFRCQDGVIQFDNPEILKVKGEVEDFIVGFRHVVAVIREQADQLTLRIFDQQEPLEKFREAELPFQLISLAQEDSITVGKNNAYFLYNQALYELNLKTGSVALQTDLAGKKIVRVMGGRAHFVAYQRTQELSSQWSTQEVVKFAQREGFEDFIKIFQTEKVTGKVLLQMDKKYTEEVLGISNVKMQQKLSIRLQESNVENPDAYLIHGWGRASEGALGTNPSKEIAKPIKVKLPADCEIVELTGTYTIIANRKLGLTYVNSIDEKTNKQEWKEVCNKKVWNAVSVDDALIFIVSATKERLAQHESEAVLNVKKEKLRTAKNIIDKITWDPNIKAEDFRVGFLDKLEGILEMPFSELESSEIKEYRIEYFKRGKEVVWDKKKRIDIL